MWLHGPFLLSIYFLQCFKTVDKKNDKIIFDSTLPKPLVVRVKEEKYSDH